MTLQQKFNPLTGLFDLVDISSGGSTTPPMWNETLQADLTVPSGYCAIMHEAIIPNGISLTIDGELVLI